MHSMTFGEFYISFNGDFSGDVEISARTSEGLISLPYWLLEEIVAEKVRRERISALEAMTRSDLIK